MHLEAIRVLCRRSRSEKRNFVEGMKKSRLIGPAHTFPPATGAFSGVIASLADQRSAPAESFKASAVNPEPYPWELSGWSDCARGTCNGQGLLHGPSGTNG